MKLSFVLLSTFSLLFGNSKFNGGTHAIKTGSSIPYIDYASFVVDLTTVTGHGTFTCGGAILSAAKFVTAAHCFNDYIRANVTLGTTERYSGRFRATFRVGRIKIHPSWRRGQHAYDIAVGFFEEPIDLLPYAYNSIPLVEPNYTLGNVMALGYGPLSGHGFLKWTGVNVMDFQACSDQYTRMSQSTNMLIRLLDENVHFCLGPLGNNINHAHKEDSGGPITDLRRTKLIGIIKGGAAGKPDVCLKIDPYREFLENPDTYTEVSRSVGTSGSQV